MAMEKYGVEVERKEPSPETANRIMEKKAAREKRCSHPADKVYISQGTKYCRRCEKYLELGNT